MTELKLTEYRIEIPAKLQIVKTIWRKFLKDDNTWHFTLEGTYIELRIDADHKSAMWVKQFEDYLKKKKWHYIKFPYHDNIPITRKYQKSFEKIFHGFSHLAMTVKREKTVKEDEAGDLRRTFERCVHLFCNLNDLNWKEEFQWSSAHALDRAYFTGYVNAQEEERRIKSDKEG